MNSTPLRTCIVQSGLDAVSETFISAHSTHLPGTIQVLHNAFGTVPLLEGQELLSQNLIARGFRKIKRFATGKEWNWEQTESYLRAFRNFRPDVVLAEYGTTGTRVFEACEIAGVPLVVHFHGYDASKKTVLKKQNGAYRKMFQKAAGVIAVSQVMRERLLSLGADPSRLYLNPYGVDKSKFTGASPELAEPIFLGVGRFVEKKAPYLTILAFAKIANEVPEAKLRMIGEGPLLEICRDIVCGLGIEEKVTFLGAQSHEVVANEMKSVRAFVQHSVESPDGDCEGTPVAILEASASGLPVISTRHAGIPDVVTDSETGFIVEERDVAGMASRMLQLILNPELAGLMGAAARKRIIQEFTMKKSINNLHEILIAAAKGGKAVKHG